MNLLFKVRLLAPACLGSIILATSMAPGVANASDIEAGKELYHEVEINQTINGVSYENANCETCHNSDVFTRENRLATNFKKLEAYVERCNTNLDVGWFPEDVTAVATYLDNEFYKFE